MAVPKQHHTKSRRNRRRSHHALSPTSFSACDNCGEMKLPHVMCEKCGYYKSRQVIDVNAKLSKKEKKELAKQLEETKKNRPLSLEELSKK